MRALLILIVSFFFSFFASAMAQSASHEVSVSIPNVLRLRIDDSQARDLGQVPVVVTVRDGELRVDPGSTTLEIFANSEWQLSASYRPASDADADAELQWRIDGGWTPFTGYASTIASGPKTGGWKQLEVAYGVASLPADGTYQGVVTYTLARP